MNSPDLNSYESWLGTVIDKKYRLDSLIGEGGMAMVFLAERLHLRDRVAIKVLRPRPNADPILMRRFQAEAAAAAKVKHPNVVAVYDFGVTDDGTVYIVMELLEGPGLDQEMHRQGRISLARTLEILKPVSSALGAAHSLGLLHRDVKPSNIILHRSQYDGVEVVKVVDFGIAKLPESSDLVVKTSEGIVLGTAEYMSPEQCQGLQLDPRSDVYSLATVCYQMLSGRLAYIAQSTADYLIKHVKEAPIPLNADCADVSEEVASAVMRALSKDPDQRPSSAPQFYNLLEAAVSSQHRKAAASKPSAAIGDRSDDSRRLRSGTRDARALETSSERSIEENLNAPKFNCFAGRSAELSAVMEAWKAACSGEAKPVIILGEPGAGKTRLLEAFCRRAEEAGAIVFHSRLYETSGSRSHHVMLADLKKYIARIQSEPEQMQDIFGPRGDAAVQKLGRLWRTGGLIEQMSESDREKRLEHFNSIADAFQTLARKRPLVLAADDIHWADESARELLTHLSRNAGRAPLFIIACARPDGDAFKAWMKTFRRESETIELTRFNKQQAFEAIEAIFGHVAITERQFNSLLADSGGNPYFLVEFLRLLLAEEKIRFDGRRWVFHDAAVRLPQALVDLVELALEKTSSEARRIIACAAVIGEEFSFELLQHAAQIDDETLHSVIESCIENGLINRLPSLKRHRFCNTTVRRVLYDGLNKRMRKRLHRLIAAWLEEHDGSVYDLAFHYYEAGEHEQAFRYAVKAADASQESFQIDELRKCLKWAEESLSEIAGLSDLESSALAGNAEFEGENLEKLELLARRRWLCGLSFVYRGRDDLAEEHLHQAASLARVLNSESLLGHIYSTLGTSRAGSGKKSEAIDLYKQALECYRRAGFLEGQGQTLRSISLLYEQRGDYALALDCARAAVETARACGNRNLESFSLSSEAWMLCRLRRFEESAVKARRALALTQKISNKAARCSCYNTIAEIYAEQGLYAEALKPRREALRIAAGMGNRRFELIIAGNLGELYFHLGRHQEAETYLLRSLKAVEASGNRFLEQLTLQYLVRVCIRLKKTAQARKYLARAEALKSSADLLESRYEFCLSAAELLLHEGKHREAIIETDEAVRLARACGSVEREWQPHLIKARAFLALGRTRQAKEAIAQSVTAIERAAEAIKDENVRERYLAYEERRAAFELYRNL